MPILIRCPQCHYLEELPKHPLGKGFKCGICAYIFFEPERYRNKELKRRKENANQ